MNEDQPGIAIVGMSGHFPGAPDVASFWRNVCTGVESITRFSPPELADSFSPEVRARANFRSARSVLENVDLFDAGFFSMHAREAELTDPQHRVFLECAWEALEDAGYDPANYAGAIGVIAGCSINTYFLRNVLGDRAAIEAFTDDYQVDSYPQLLGAGNDFLATRVAYKLDLRGPAITVQTACSTALTAVAQACSALVSGQADMMLAGGVSISFPQARGYLHQAGAMVSGDGQCRPFDAAASGTIFGAGAGAVVLKRLADAVRDNDTIYAVIRGFAINNDGARKAGFTAPSATGQAAAVSAAYRMAGFDPRSVQYVECHGTATPLGDPIEFAALARVFPAAPDGSAYCALGSVKSNVGHLDIAAGMSGLVKTALCVQTGRLPATLHFDRPNPRIPLNGSPFFVNTQLRDWPAGDGPRRAGISAFGVGGTNVHLALEEQPSRGPATAARGAHLLILSARSEAALDAARIRLSAYLRATPEANLADVAFTLQAGRRAFPYRAALTAASVNDAIEKLAAPFGTRTRAAAKAPAVAYLFPGQGVQYTNMGRGVYDRFPVFRVALDRCAAILKPLLGHDIRDTLYPSESAADAGRTLTSTEVAQPAIFAVEYALAQLWRSLGIAPAAMAGHSVGEFVAATLAGVLTVEDAVALVAERGRLMQSLPGGAMLAVRLSSSELAPFLVAPLALAAANSPALCVAAGPFDAIAALEVELRTRGVEFRRLETSHAFHSPMMEPIVAPLTARVAALTLGEPAIPYVSGLSGAWITPAEATAPTYWAQHCRAAVQFDVTLQTLCDSAIPIFLEVGPGAVLSTFARQGAAKAAGTTIVESLPGPHRERDDCESLLAALGQLWVAGAQPNWLAIYPLQPRRTSLPTYAFERSRHWLEEAAPAAPVSAANLDTEHRPVESTAPPTGAAGAPRHARIQRDLIDLLEELSGETIAAAECQSSFLELGFDSLFLGRFVQRLGSRFNVALTFRQLLSDVPSIATLTDFIARTLPPETRDRVDGVLAANSIVVPASAGEGAPASVASLAAHAVPVTRSAPLAAAPGMAAGSGLEAIIREQLATMQGLMREQLLALQNGAERARVQSDSDIMRPVATTLPTPLPVTPAPATAAAPNLEAPSRFEVFRPGSNAPGAELTAAQHAHIDDLIARTVARTPKSKELTQKHRAVLADPRVAAGFRSEWKEMVYPIACDRAKGSRLWDIDGNRYIDVLNGFGQTAFGHSPDFVVEALEQQLKRGFPIGPQTSLAGEVAELFCELTGNERVTFCNTGSEAVMAALRLARTVTGRDRVVVFSGAYHGQFDEVLVKGARNSQRALPVAPGIPAQSVANMVVLPYADNASLAWVREHASELAAVVVEPVQSRHPDLQPQAFLREIRAITEASGTAFIFDEVVTGFRLHPGGLQAVFGIRADLATYGKVVGGGMPIGILAGTARFMDALDGGMWQYGDDSVPDVAPTFFAGTFVRHPLVMSAVLAVLRHLKAQGPQLQAALATRTATMIGRLNADLERRGVVSRIETYGSLFYCNFSAEDRLSSLLYYHLRLRGIYISEGFPCFLTTAHSAFDIETIITAFGQSFDELQAVGIFAPPAKTAVAIAADADAAVPAAVVANPRRIDVALSEAQTEIWLAAQLSDAASCAFNESFRLQLDGQLDETAFAGAWDALIERHDALRSIFAATGESLHLAAPAGLRYAFSDLSTLAREDAQRAVDDTIARDAATAFDLMNGPAVRGHLLRISADAHAFIFTAHHIVCDGWSINVLLHEFAALYTAAVQHTAVELGAALSFSEYARRQAQRPADERAAVEAFWLALYKDPVRPLELPADRPRPARKSFAGSVRTAHIGLEQYRNIKRAGARSGCTLFVTLLAAFNVLAGRLAAADDVVVGVPAAGQALLDDAILVGHCVDLLPIRQRWHSRTRLSDLLATLKTRVLDAYEHQDYTFGTLVRKLALPRALNRLPLAEIQFNLERVADDLHLPALRTTVIPNPKAFVNFDLFLNIIESSAGLRLDCDYNTDLFDAATIDRWLAAYGTILDAIVHAPETLASEVALGAELRPLEIAESTQPLRIDETTPPLAIAAGIAAGDSRAATLLSLFEAQVLLRPNTIAATFGDEELSYAALDRRANALAALLDARIGGHGKRIGIAVARSLDMLVALLATHKAGHAYVPLDTTHPAARLAFILADADVAGLITSGMADIATRPGIPVIHFDLDRAALAAARTVAAPHSPRPDEIAYAIYTSGSSGTPKGVEISHGALGNFLTVMLREPGFTASDTMLAVTTIAFDIAALELFLPLVAGGTVAIASSAEARDGFRLAQRLQESRATVMQATPATWSMLLEAGFEPERGFTMLCGGEALRRDLADRLLRGNGVLWNMYGPTETTIWSACVRIAAAGPIVVGPPIANTQFYVLDRHDTPVDIGTVGQLHIGGDGLARGYLNRAELTAEKFISNPFGAGRLYRTGDLARQQAGGAFEILGRIDEQIKLRGYRIELGEIETVLMQHTQIAAAAVALRHDRSGEPRLVAYYVERSGTPVGPQTLHAAAAEHLPDYMIPSIWLPLPALPLNPNGKLDRAALPLPPAAVADADPAYEAPQTATEKALAQIWASVLSRDRIGKSDDIFALGADSIQIFQIVARANRQGVPVLAKQLIQHRTLGNTATHIDRALHAPLAQPHQPKRRSLAEAIARVSASSER